MSGNGTKSQKKKDKKRIKKRNLAIRIIVSIGLLIFFLSNVDLSETVNIIANTNYLLLLACVILYLIGQSISAYKWTIISRAIGFINTKFSKLIQYYYVGMFFNLFLPSTVGGDAVKAYYLSKNDTDGRKAPAIYTVLAERFSGLTVLVILGTTALMTPYAEAVPISVKYVAVGLLLWIAIGAPTFPFIIRKFFSEKHWLNRSLLKDVMVFWNYKLVLVTLWWSLVFHTIIILIHILISTAMNLDVNPFYYAAMYPIIAIIGFVPIAFNGIGVREGAYIYFLSIVGVSQSAGLAFGLIWFAIVVINSLFGGIVYIKGGLTPPPEDYEPEKIGYDPEEEADEKTSETAKNQEQSSTDIQYT